MNAMKISSLHKSLFLVILLTVCLTVSERAEAQPGVFVSHETFYHELRPYGHWIQDPEFGRVWLPDVGRNFHPYVTNGHWVMTEYGNTWVSDYAWGWGPFHYGRWHHDNYYGWMWVPGNEWGPAWVAWRNGGGYYGWAPLGPRLNINISVNIGGRIPHSYWSFVRYGHFMRHNLYRYCAPRRHVTRIINRTTVINNTYVYNDRHVYYTGPQARHIERATRQRVQVHRVNHVERRGTSVAHNGEVSLYRPTTRGSRGTADYRSRSNASPSRSRGSADYRGNRSSDVSRNRSNVTPRNSRGSAYQRNAGTTHGRSSVENGRSSRSSQSSRETNYRNGSSRENRGSYSPAQRGSRSASPQQYGNSRKNTTTRSRIDRSIQRSTSARSYNKDARSGSSGTYQRGSQSRRSSSISRSSGERSSGTSRSRGSNTYQRKSRSSSQAVKSRSSGQRESGSRSSRGSRGGGN